MVREGPAEPPPPLLHDTSTRRHTRRIGIGVTAAIIIVLVLLYVLLR